MKQSGAIIGRHYEHMADKLGLADMVAGRVRDPQRPGRRIIMTYSTVALLGWMIAYEPSTKE